MKRRLSVGLLVGLMVALLPLAYASPVDPSFPVGFYDNGDFDDVIVHLTSRVSAVDAALLHVPSAVALVVGTLCPAEPRDVPAGVLGAVPSRAPPLG